MSILEIPSIGDGLPSIGQPWGVPPCQNHCPRHFDQAHLGQILNNVIVHLPMTIWCNSNLFWKIWSGGGRGDRSPTDFFRIGQNSDFYFKNLNVINQICKKIYIKQYISTASFFNFLEFLRFFLYFSRFFENLNSIFWKNYNFVLSFLHTAICNIWVNWYFSTHLWYTRVCGKIKIHPNIASGGVQERQNQNIYKYLQIWGHNFATDSPNDLIFWLRS